MGEMSYFPLDRSIFSSTLWASGSVEGRLLWIYLLGAADPRDGVVRETIPGIALRANLPLESVEREIEWLSLPDKYSRTKDFEGRRIEVTEEGVVVLNYQKYRDKDHSTNRVKKYDERILGKTGQRRKHRGNAENIGATVGNAEGNDGQLTRIINKETNINTRALDNHITENHESEEHPLDIPHDDHSEFDSGRLAEIIDEVRRGHQMTPYRPKMSDYQKRQDAVDEIIAITESENVDPEVVAKTSYRNFVESKDAWLHNAGYPIGAYAQKVGHYYRPPKPIKDQESQPEPSRRAVYDRDTEEFERKAKESMKRYQQENPKERYQAMASAKDLLENIKKKSKLTK